MTVGAVPPQGLGPGDRGPQVKVLEDLLAAQHYGAHAVDDLYDQDTADAVVAFQKAKGLPRTGRATQDVADAVSTSGPPDPLVPGGGPTRVEIDLPRQILLLYQNDALFRVLPVSTGSGKRFCHGGRCRRAVTPAGSYRVGYRLPGWRKSPLGRMYKPVYYMVGIGIAIHGYRQVPYEPASHGCVRIPMTAAEWFPDYVPDGTPVYVLDGKTPPGPPPPEGTQT
jgi:lipoprotein-anchoring transpeptidase ErfK/SrfK